MDELKVYMIGEKMDFDKNYLAYLNLKFIPTNVCSIRMIFISSIEKSIKTKQLNK